MLNNVFFAANFFLDKAYPVLVVIIKVKTIATTVTRIELNKYLVIGTPVLDAALNKSVKFLSVGFCTKNLGGNWNNSSSGFNA